MSRKNIENIYSLSPMQQGLLFHALVASHEASYPVQIDWTLRGNLDEAAFLRAWQEVVDRHPILRTAFAWERLEKPMQIVRKRILIPVEQRDLREMPEGERQAWVKRYAAEERDKSFDLTRAPLMRLSLLRLQDDTYRFIWSLHHLIIDGWSIPLVVKEVFALYAAFGAGTAPNLERVRPFGDYIGWLNKQSLASAEAFWKNALAGFSAPTPFCVDHPAKKGESHEIDETMLAFSEAESAALTTFARQHQLTLSTLVQGAWALLLARYSGEDDVLFGATVSGRSAPVPGIDRMVGLFINTLPVRVKVPADKPIVAWLQALQDQYAELREHEHSQLVEVQGWSEVPRGVPLFESQVAFENYPEAEALLQGAGGLTVDRARMETRTHYPLTVVAVFQKILMVRISSDRRRFELPTVERMLQHLRRLLAGMHEQPTARVGELPLLSDDEEHRVLVTWNGSAVAFPEGERVHQLFEARADATPDATALVAGSTRLTYRELEQQGNRLAHHLQRLGVGPDSVVGLAMGRTAEIIVGLLGILKAGGAYVPIDPAYPPARIARIVAEAGVMVIVTLGEFGPAMPTAGVTVVCLDHSSAALAEESDARAASAVTSSSLAYVLFTSGSTGAPKGVAIEHRQLVNYVRGVGSKLGLPDGASYAHLSTFSADLGNTVLFPPLCLGGTLHVIPQDLTTDPDGLAGYFTRERIDCLKIVPSHLAALLSGSHPERLIPRRLLVLGGEGSSWDLIARIAKLAPDCRILNHYGPTETTVGVLTYPVEATAPVATAFVPLGRPLPNSRVYVLDALRQPTPFGVPGELYIGGDGVARGYLDRPELTAERFVPDPFGPPGSRLYRTGDRARCLPDGTICFLGRLDFQVKIRGFRIELGEIEAALQAHPAVAEGVVLAQEEASGDKRLVAYLVATAGTIDLADLRTSLSSRLPGYMIPAAFVVLEALPLTSSGKIDRRALPALESSRVREAAPHVGPRNPVEEVLAGIWSDVFDRPEIGVHERFSDLGGHSLLAIQIIARAREAFQSEIPLRAIFEHPTIAALAEAVRASMREEVGLAAPPIARVRRDGALRLSFAQERLWFLDQLEPGSAIYNVPSGLRIKGALDPSALDRALREIIRRHEVLRTTFTSFEGRPTQVIHEAIDFPFPLDRVGPVPSAERDSVVRRHAELEAARPFDLGTGPLVRARLVELDGDDHVLLLTLHHIVSDGWTRGIFNRELTTLYTAFLAGAPSPLPELALQYADYAAWQRGWLAGEILDRQIAYWKKQLAFAPPAIELPTDRPRPPVQRYRGGQRITVLSADLARALKDLARREGVTLYMTLLAALDVLLHRYTGQDDVVVGTSISSRGHADTEGMIGFFINSLALRVRLAPELTFVELLARVRDVCLGAYAHQDLPFERLVQELQPEPDPGRSPLFQVIFTMQNAPVSAIELAGLQLRPVKAESATVKYDLTFVMGETPGGLGVSIEYSTDLFDASTIERMLGHLGTLLEGVVQAPDARVGDLPLLRDEERRRLLGAWNDTAAAFSIDEAIHELFEAQVDATPELTAVVAGLDRLTFRELDRRANRLAHHLRARGVGPESVVGLAVSRSAGMIVGLLGILKAGGAYLPLDPAYPRPRLAEILAEARATVVVTEGRFAASLPDGVRVVRLDDAAAAILAESDARPESAVTAQNLAYVLFTSGSTGAPKGVAIEHRQLVSYVRGVMTRLALPDEASYAHVSTFSADLGNTALFPPLVSGGCLHVIAEELTTNPGALAGYFTRERIDCLKIVPSHLAALLSVADPARILPSRLLVLGGEASTWELVARLEKLAPEMRILNHYGPTETTVGVLTYAVVKGHPAPAPIVPLGRPLPNSRVHVLDAQRRPTPIGVPGEIYIGGAGVARGYLNRPDLTAERFVSDPFGPAGSRLYRTGDRARYLSDGSLVFLGRADFQVKVRGYRVELGEIEAALAADVGVAEAVVLAPEDSPGDRRLVACVVLRDGATVGDVKSRLGDRLPEHLVPGSFVAIATIPLTLNGKIDRRALAAEVGPRGAPDDGHAPPRNPVEEVLAAIWTDVFDRERIGIHERFSDLGGHSLLAIQIVARARDAFQTQLALRAIFESPTIAGLAERIEESLRADDGAVVPPIRRAPREQPLRLSFAQERLWFLDQLDPGSASYSIPAAIRLTGDLDANALERALAAIYRRHEVLRTTFTAEDGRPRQVIHADATLRFMIHDLGEMLADDREAAMRAEVAAEARLPFDLARGPLFRARLIRLGVDEHVLLYTMHHIVSDAWTRGILNRELGALYEAFAGGRPSPLPELPIQYADYAEWQRAWLDGEALAQRLAYWKKHLEGAPSSIDLPIDRPRPPVQTFRGERRFFELSAELRRGLEELSRRCGATLFMTLLAAFDVLLHRLSGQADLVVGTPILNRTRQETEGLIGLFLNTLAIRVEIAPRVTFRELVERVREACLGAYAHQDLPFERLVAELSPERDLGRSPLFQVMFTLQNAPGDAPRLGGLRLSPVASGIGTSKLDLTLGFALGEGKGGLFGSFEYSSDLFDEATIDRMIEHLRTLLEGVVEDAERPVVAIPILTVMEREHVLVGLNATRVERPSGLLIHQLFEAQADRTPGEIALVFEGNSLTYGALDRRANQLAHALRERGVGPDVLVGVCLDRSLDLVIALYGVLKAGGAYVPLDPAYPRDRLAFMVEDARVPVLLTQARVEAALPPHGARVIRLDAEWAQIAKQPDSRLERGDLGLHHLAYVIYTSGSTGRPKGVMNEHRGVLNRLQWMQSAHGLTGDDRVLQKTPFSFDVSVWELFWPLMCGATLVVARPEGHKDPAYLVDLIEAQGITTLHFVPSMLEVFTAELSGAARPRCGSIARVFASGEALLPAMVDAFAARLPGAALHNLYGPTEAAVDVTAWECKAGSAIVPIGKPIDNVRIYLLDERRQPVPVGVRGELYIGGVQVARGYLNRDELTADRFVPDPFVPEQGYPLYRTGDLARWLPDGAIEFLGRVDNQVKIRGFRVELGEIEAALAEHPATRGVVIVAREMSPGDRRLIAYLTCVEGPAPTVGELRRFLEATLPDYMIPAAFVVLGELPLTSSGKVDRLALPAPEEAERLEPGSAFVAPRSDVEEALCRIWAGVLRLDQVGVHDNFFAVGGDSILSIRIVARAQQAGLSITPRQIFQHQTVAELAEVAVSLEAGGATPADLPRASLSQEVIDALAVHDPGVRGHRDTIDDIYPLSPMQQGLLFHTLIAPDTGAYIVHVSWTIRGDLDVAAFSRAFDEVANRHPILRTAFLWERLERPIQVVRKRVKVPVTIEDLRGLSPEAQAARSAEVAEADRRRPFDLAQAPLMRLTFLRLADDEHRFYWSRHHLVMDGWSTPIVVREVFALYEAFTRGNEAQLERVRPYSDYIAWIGAQDTAKSEDFWRRQLRGFREPTPLGIGRQAAPGAVEELDEQRFVLSEATSSKLASFGRQHQLTMSTVLQGAWALLLARYSGEDEVLFGATVSGRSAPVPGIDRLVGLFINTLAVRVAVDPAAPALAWLEALQEQHSGLREHEHTPLVQVQGWSEIPRGTQLFESLVVFQNYPAEESLKQGVRGLTILDSHTTERPPYPLTVFAAFRRTLLVRVAYDRRRFEAPAVERLLGHLRSLLEGIAAHPDRRLGELSILTADERHELIYGLDGTAFTHPEAACLSDVFEAQVETTPDAIALVFEEKSITYRELDRRSNQLAHALRERGVGPEVLVGVCLDRSIELVVALHGVHKAGGAYVPLDPEYPKDRLAFMLDDAKVAVVLTQAHLLGALPEHGAPMICLDSEWETIAGEPESRPGRGEITPDTLAYVIYTSGSTGRPKGAMNAHRGILNRLFWMQRAYAVGPGDRVLQKTPFSFDVSVWELFWPLMFGATLVVARPEGHKDPGYLAGLIQASGITTMHFVPSMLKVFLDDVRAAGCTSLRRVFCSGEALLPPLVDAFFARFGATELINLYGPTEAAVDVTFFACRPGLPVIPIGRPVDNTHIYLLDARGEPVPRGVQGELYIGGAQVARGYLDRPELTAKRFLPDPFRRAGGRVYRTGDLARWLPDGSIEYLGRADFQVKIRGFRVELGEIESALLRHGRVSEVVVVAREDRPGEKRLVAYLVGAPGPAPSVGELRAFLKETLPDYMLPAAFIVLLALPLTVSGKIDRRALPAPDEGERLATDEAFVAPRGRAAEELSRIWASVLRLPQVGVHDNFFEIGGDSILSIQIVSRAQLAGLSITPRQVFEHPTVAGLAAVTGSRGAISAEQGAVTGAAPLTPVQQWFLELAPEDPGHWNQKSFLEVKAPLDPDALEFAVAELIRHHDALRLRVAKRGAGFEQEFAPPPPETPFRRVDLTSLGDAEGAEAIEQTARATHASLDLASGPVLRVVLFDLGPTRPSRLLIVIHHLAVDGVSWRILLEDLWTAYGQRLRAEAIALPPKTTSFKRWAEQLAEHAKSPTIRGESGYWLDAARAASRPIPIDHERGDNDERSVRVVVASLSAEETESLLRDVPEAYRTQISDVLLTAFAQVLGAWTGTPGARVDLEGHGREELFADADLTRSVGWFTAVFPVVIDLPENQGPGPALKSVKEQLRALPGRGLGYGMLRYLGDPAVAERLRAAPQSEVVFNYLGQRDQALPEESPFRWARESSGPPRSPRGRRRYLLDVNATIAEGRLHVRWFYSENRHERVTIEALASRYGAALSALIAHCVSPAARGVTPSDFQDAGLSQEALDMLVGIVDDDQLS